MRVRKGGIEPYNSFIHYPLYAWLLCDWHVLRKKVTYKSVLHIPVYLSRVVSALTQEPWLLRRGKALDCKIEFVFLPCYPFVWPPSLKSRPNIHLPPSHFCHTSFLTYSLKESGRNDLCLCAIGVWLQSKLIWKADARTSYFTHWNAKAITVTPAEPWVANLVWGFPFSWWALTPRFVSFSSIVQFSLSHRQSCFEQAFAYSIEIWPNNLQKSFTGAQMNNDIQTKLVKKYVPMVFLGFCFCLALL